MFSHFFIHRPIFACVISLVIMFVGGIAYFQLPTEQTPNITPPTVQVSARYPGAGAAVIADTVAAPIEEQVNGVENMLYMQSKSSDDGTMNLTVTFEVGTDVDMANVLTQNRVAIAQPGLPEEVKKEGVTTKKQSTNIVLLATVYSPNGSMDELELTNVIMRELRDKIAVLKGVGDVQVMGAKDFGMRIWLDPEQMASYNLTTIDVINALREQNVQVAAGQIGAPPSPTGQQFQYTVTTKGRLETKEDFEDVIVKVARVDGDVRTVKLGNIARVQIGAQAYNWSVRLTSAGSAVDEGAAKLNNVPAVAMAVYQLPGANALEVRKQVGETLAEIAARDVRFTSGQVAYSIPYDTTRFIEASIDEVIETLFIAVVLVVAVVFIFLQDWRATLVPAATIPVALIGTFAVMLGLDMSLNTLSLFGIVLAIGIVVDDAIIVVENTKRLMDEEGLDSKAATAKAMTQITGPVIATTLVLLAVFVPTMVLGGITGQLYRQFAITISVATIFSSINALTLSPALCGMLLRPTPQKQFVLARWYNRNFDRATAGYSTLVRSFLKAFPLLMLVWVILGGAFLWLFSAVPTGFLPNEDQGYVMVHIQLPEAATLQRTEAVLQTASEAVMEIEGVTNVVGVAGYSLLDSLATSNNGAMFVTLAPWSERTTLKSSARGILMQIHRRLARIEEAAFLPFSPPPISGLGAAGGFEMQMQLRSGGDLQELEAVAGRLVGFGNSDEVPQVTRMNSSFRAGVPQFYVDVDREKAMRQGVELSSVFSTLQAFLGSAYVNDFNYEGRVYRVFVQAEADFRSVQQDILNLQVRNDQGKMVPLETLATVIDTAGPKTVFRFNKLPSSQITGTPGAGYSSGEAIDALQAMFVEVAPQSIGYQWSGVTFQELNAGNPMLIFAAALVFVYMFLAAQYESWAAPISVLLSVPLALLGGMLLTWVFRYDNNVYTQIGLVLLIGLSAKTAILIVEFARELRAEGKSLLDSGLLAAELRFRAILMTAFSFILGVVPLVVASGAGAGSRRALGTAVFGGMLLATILGVFFVPVLYLAVQWVAERFPKITEPGRRNIPPDPPASNEAEAIRGAAEHHAKS